MQTVQEIQQAIASLSDDDYARVREWMAEFESDSWDRQIEADVEAGRLDFLIAEAIEARDQGRLIDLDVAERS